MSETTMPAAPDSHASLQLAASPAAERRLQQLDLLQRLTEAVNRAEDLTTIYEEAIEGMLGALHADRAAVVLFESGDALRYKAWRNVSAEYRRAMESRSPWRQGEPNPQPIVISDTRTDASVRQHLDVLEQEGVRALLLVPLVDAGELLGRVVLYYDRPHEPEPQDVRMAETIARHVALAITRRRSWDALAKSEATFAALAEHSPDIIARFDRRCRHLYVNPAVERLAGRPRAHFIGRSNRELGMPEEVVSRWEEALRGVFASGTELDIEFEHQTPHGIRFFESRMVPEHAASGEVISVLVTTRDLTERREAEHRLRFLTEASTALSSSLDLRTTFEAVTRIASESLGDACAIDMLRHDGRVERIAIHARSPQIAELFTEMERRYPEDLGGTAGNIVALRTGEPQLYSRITDALMQAASRDEGHLEFWRRLNLRAAMCVPLIARDRRLGVVTVVSTDPARPYGDADLDVLIEFARRAAVAIDHAMLFEETRLARDEAQQANAAKASFLAVMSHELRTPLAAVLGYAELVADEIVGPVNPTQRDQLERIKSSGTHLLMLIEEILSFARIESGHETVRQEDVELRELAGDALAVVQPLASKKHLELTLSAPAEPVVLLTDPGKVRQILLNLLGNAIKFTDSGMVNVAITPELPAVRITVTDTGVGIPAQHLEHVFDAFWQVEHVTTRRKGGTGLGLSVARQLARLLGGDISVESELGQGSRFAVVLPRSASAA